MDVDGYETPDEAALADWSTTSEAHVIESKIAGDEAIVVVDTVLSHPMRVFLPAPTGR